MAVFGPEIADELLAACQTGLAEIGGAFGRSLGCAVEATVGQAIPLEGQVLPAEPGLALVFEIGQSGAIAILPESCGLLPAWYSQPDATGQSKLGTLATELGMLMFPEDFLPDNFRAFRVSNLAEALVQAQPAADAMQATLSLKEASGGGELMLIWPVARPSEVSAATAAAAVGALPAQPQGAEEQRPTAASGGKATTSRVQRHAMTQEQSLPSYSRSLLRIQVPVIVSLASKKQPVGHIIELGPGSIIQFDKSCEELLELEVGGHKIAVGEAVKVGDKFGIRLASLILPDDRFVPVGKPAASR